MTKTFFISMDEAEFSELLRFIISQELAKALKQSQDELLSVKETCAKLKISQSTLNRMTKAGIIQAVMMGNRPRYAQSEVQRVIANKRWR